MTEQDLQNQLSALRISLTAAGVSPSLLDALGKKIKIDDETEVTVDSEYLAKQIRDSVVTKTLLEGRHKEYEPYKKELEEITRKRFNEEIKEIGEALLPENPELAKEIAKKYKEAGRYTPSELRKYAAELAKVRISEYEERLKSVSLEGKEFQQVLDAERRHRTEIEQAKRELEAQLERLRNEELPELESRFKSEIERVKWETKLFSEFYKLPSIYDDEIQAGRRDAELAKENHIRNWLINSFNTYFEAKPDGHGNIQFYERGKVDPIWVTNQYGQRVPATLSDVVFLIAKDPVKGGRYYKASNGGSKGFLVPHEESAKALEKDKKRNSFFGR